MQYIADVHGALCDAHYATPGRTRGNDSNTTHVTTRPRTLRPRAVAAAEALLSHDEAPFATQPPRVDVHGARVGEVQTCRVTFVNRSRTTQRLRLLPLRDDAHAAFRVTLQPPAPCLAPGLSCTATVTHAPTTRAGCAATATLLACCADGCWAIPLRAMPAAAQLSCSVDSVDLGVVRVGETTTTLTQQQPHAVVLRNDGACDARVHLQGSALSLVRDGVLQLRPATTRFVVPVHGQYTLSLACTPTSPCSIDAELHVCEAMAAAALPACCLRVRARGVASAVHLQHDDIDFALCYRGASYRAAVTVVNDGSVVATATARVRADVRGVLHVAPASAVVQAHDAMTLQLHYTPQTTDEDSSSELDTTVAFDVTCGGHALALPLLLRVRATAMPRELQLDTRDVACGDVLIGSACERSLRVRNSTPLPQTCGVLDEDDDNGVLTLRPRAATLLPGEMYAFVLRVTPRCDGVATHTLMLCDERGTRYVVRVRVRGVVPAVLATPCVLQLPPCAIGDRVSAATTLHVVHDEEGSGATRVVSFRVSSPMLRVSPSPCEVVAHAGSALVVVTLTPDAACDDSVVATSPYATWQCEHDAHTNARSWHSTQYVQCVCDACVMCTVAVRCVVVQPRVVVVVGSSDSATTDAVTCSAHVDFGTLAAGDVARRTCVLRRVDGSGDDVVLRVLPCGAQSPFAAQLVATTHSTPALLQLQYTPGASTGVHRDVVRVATGVGHDVLVHVRGRCAAGDVLVTTEDNDDDEAASPLHFVPVRCGDAVSRVVHVRNASTVDMHVALRVHTPHDDDVDDDDEALQLVQRVFFLQSSRLMLRAGERASCALRFCPRDAGAYAATLQLHTASGVCRRIALRGCAYDRHTYVTARSRACVEDDGSDDDATCSACFAPLSSVAGSVPARALVLRLSSTRAAAQVVVGVVHSTTSVVVECSVSAYGDGDDDEAAAAWHVTPSRLTLGNGQHDAIVTFARRSGDVTSVSSLARSCTFAVTLRCSSDVAYNSVHYVRCVAT